MRHVFAAAPLWFACAGASPPPVGEPVAASGPAGPIAWRRARAAPAGRDRVLVEGNADW
jgi:hypothetical protein